jgi:hypothetical protein
MYCRFSVGRDEEVILVKLERYVVAWYHPVVLITFLFPLTILTFAELYSFFTYYEEHGSFSAYELVRMTLIVPFQSILPLTQQQPKPHVIERFIMPKSHVGAT